MQTWKNLLFLYIVSDSSLIYPRSCLYLCHWFIYLHILYYIMDKHWTNFDGVGKLDNVFAKSARHLLICGLRLHVYFNVYQRLCNRDCQKKSCNRGKHRTTQLRMTLNDGWNLQQAGWSATLLDRAFISRRRLAYKLLLLEVVAVQAVHNDCPFRINILLCHCIVCNKVSDKTCRFVFQHSNL